MQTSYIYSVSRVNALSEFLLTKADIDRLLVAEPGNELRSALKETYLAPYVSAVPDESVPLAISKTLIDAKKMIYKIAPKGKGEMFRILWIQYDIHNLRVFSKAKANGYSLEDCRPFVSERGICTADYIYSKIVDGSLDSIYKGWQAAYDKALEAVKEGRIDLVDGIFDELYFETSKFIVDKKGDSFIKSYMKRVIDIYNLRSRLRHLKNETVSFGPTFVLGGNIKEEEIETMEDTIAAFGSLGGDAFWKDSLDLFQKTGNFTPIDVNSNEFLIEFSKDASSDMFSSSSLVLYYLKCRQSAANIRAIVIGKNSGMSVADIRANLRMAYVNE